ncbi:MAG TPA: pitrilysin family protein [Verrucomicrobiae bacterium]|jgi:zinc protease
MPNKKIIAFLVAVFSLFLSLVSIKADESVTDVKIDIPYKKFVLTNGLTLIVHEDHKAPIVAVNLWYHVGSKNEKPGKTGFAHLFEHLMFSGSEHLKAPEGQNIFMEAMERIGATDLNGTTGNDRTDFFENVPRNALDVALWIESDRMGHLLGTVDKTRLDKQRGVVQNEKRQGENEPYGMADELITKGTAPVGHPYSWTVIGSMDDLNAASLDDVKTWFTNYYGAANAVLVLAGDIDPDTALKKAEEYFAEIPSGPPVARYRTWIPKIPGTRREVVADRVPQARLYKVWTIPPYGEADTTYLDLVSDIFVSPGKSSRLYKRLVYDDQIATDVSAIVEPGEISSRFEIFANARPGEDLAKVEKAIDEEVARFLRDGPTQEELQHVQAGKIAGFVRGIERIGGSGGKSDVLAMNETYRGSPDFFQVPLKYTREATTAEVQRAAKQWLTDDVYILEIHPFPNYETVASAVDRSKLPTPGPDPEVKFPTFQRAELANGMKIIVAERHSVPLVSLSLLMDAGYAADQFAVPGTAKLTMQMLEEGTARRTAFQISDELQLLGASLGTDSHLDSSSVNLSTITSTLDSALDIYADVVLNPSFPETNFQRRKKELLADIQQEKTEPIGISLRVFPKLLYGSGHAYSNPLRGSGTEESVEKLTVADLQKFHDTWFKPNNATLIVVGDTTLQEMTPKLEKLFASWKAGDVPSKNLAFVEQQKKSSVYMIDRPGSIQSLILAGHVGLPKSNPDEIAIETMNTVLGGAFSSRVNMNLREEKHWSYGAGTVVFAARGQGPFIAFAPVQSDKTKESMIELNKELHGILGQRPISDQELTTAQKNETLALPGSWETIDSVSTSIEDMVKFGLPDDYYNTYPAKVRALTASDLVNAAQKEVHPDQLVWVIVGDRAKIESGVRELGWGDIHFLDADGNAVK